MSVNATEYKVDRTGWDRGAWDGEPDRVDFVHAGFACLLLRSPSFGQWCGYVAVPESHPDYGKLEPGARVEVHGGITYAGACSGHICHVPAPGMPDNVWWFGFDCGHCFDYSPGLLMPLIKPRSWAEYLPLTVYRDVAYARHEVERLADQLKCAR